MTHLGISEEEDGVVVVYSGHRVENLQIVVEGSVVVTTTQLYLETLVAVDVRRQPETGNTAVIHHLIIIVDNSFSLFSLNNFFFFFFLCYFYM